LNQREKNRAGFIVSYPAVLMGFQALLVAFIVIKKNELCHGCEGER
jgi:hypothetical protein